ncbi:MAG: MlaD family protein [bacterium]|nr:MlaD family protein [bacterium]
MAITKRRYLDIILGVFVLVGLVLFGTFIFLIGNQRRLFDDAVYVNAYYPNVAGLNLGADVLLAGVVVGRVSEITFPALKRGMPVSERQIKVKFRISSDMLQWIREDSVAQIDSKGLLGDKTINISMGSPDVELIKDGGIIQSMPPLDFNNALAKAQEVLGSITDSITGAREFLEGFKSKGGDTALADAAIAFKNILQEVQSGDGIVHKLVFDKKAGQEFQKLVSSLRHGADSVSTVLGEVKNGDGMLHALIYNKQGADIVKTANAILHDINSVIKEVKSGSGMAHSLIYDSEQGNLVSNLNAAAADLKAIISSVQKGQGTLGRLLVDPSIYDDLKLILGRVKRNEVLKSLIRFSLPKNSGEAVDENVIINEQ